MPVTCRELEETNEAVWAALERAEVRARLPVLGADIDLLVRAGTRALRTLEAIQDDTDLWRRARDVDHLPERLGADRCARIREALSSDLGILLAGLGYRPPPPLLEFRRDVDEALTRILEPPSWSTGPPPGPDEAERALAYLTFRLRSLLRRAVGPAPPAPGELRRAVGVSAGVLRRLTPGAARGGVGTAVKLLVPVPIINEILGGVAGEVAAELVQDLLLRGALPEVVAEVATLREGEMLDWEDDVSRALVDVHSRAARAVIAWDVHDRVGVDAAFFLAREQLAAADAHWHVLAEFATRPSIWGAPVDLDAARPSHPPDAVGVVIAALDRARALDEPEPTGSLDALREVARAAEHALAVLRRPRRSHDGGPDARGRHDHDEGGDEREDKAQGRGAWRDR